MRAKLVVEAFNFQKHKDPKDALGLLPRKYVEFVKAFHNLKIESDFEDEYSSNLKKYNLDSYIISFMSSTYQSIGEEVGNFIAEFYNYDVPIDPTDESSLDPYIIKAIDDWLMERYPDIAIEDLSRKDNYRIVFWEGLISGIDF